MSDEIAAGQIYVTVPYPKNRGWFGCDLDGTLAKYESGDFERFGGTHIGEPIPKMVERIKNHLKRGDEVRIVTARASENAEVIVAIRDWCELHLGYRLIVTDQKDFEMIALYDDRAIQIVTNTGERVDGKD